MDPYTKTTIGYIQAAFKRAEQDQRRQQNSGKYPRYAYEDWQRVVHIQGCLSPERRAHIEALVHQLRSTEGEEREAIIRQLVPEPVRIVTTKLAKIQDHSRYPAPVLRAIRKAGGGIKEQARARKRAGAVTQAA